MKKRKIIKSISFFLLILCLTSCTPEITTESEYGFFGGLWHGVIMPISSIGAIFGVNGLIASTNTGFTYYLGIGISILLDLLILVGVSKS